MNHHVTEEQLIDYLHGELAPGADAALLLHLDQCVPCRAEYAAQARLTESLRAYARATERDLPLGFEARVLAAAESSSAPRSTWDWRTWLRPAFAIPVGAALAIALYAAGFGFNNHPVTAATTIDAAYYLDDHAKLTSRVPFNEGATVPSSLYTAENVNGAQ